VIQILAIIFLLATSSVCGAADPCTAYTCLAHPGTVCVDGKCIPVTTPTPAPTTTPTPTPQGELSVIKLNSVPQAEIVPVAVDCSKLNLKNVRVILHRKDPPGNAYYYSMIYRQYKDFRGNDAVDSWVARKDMLNRYAFIFMRDGDTIQPQIAGFETIFMEWSDPAFTDVFSATTCDDLKKSGLFFSFGLSFHADRSDYEGAVFYFK
jgi:hypothetical protein